MGLQSKLKDIEITLLGNRLASLGFALTTGGAGRLLINPEDYILSSIILGAGVFLLANCLPKRGTRNHYLRTKNYIQTHGSLDFDFVKDQIKSHCRYNLYGYCHLQGMYLAAKEHNQLGVFERARKYSRNLIPNF